MTTIHIHRAGPQLPVITTFGRVPKMVQGLVRDVRLRWALEEAGQPYVVNLIGAADQNTPQHRALQPFGQVPAYQHGALTLFESGAIVHHIACGSPALMPDDDAGRSRTLAWTFAALNSVEPAVGALWEHDHFGGGEAQAERRAALLERVQARLDALQAELTDRDYLLSRFTAADILMATVLRSLGSSDVLANYPVLQAYLERCNARPAARKALADHVAVFAPREEAKEPMDQHLTLAQASERIEALQKKTGRGQVEDDANRGAP